MSKIDNKLNDILADIIANIIQKGIGEYPKLRDQAIKDIKDVCKG